ncbi:MAG TPA: aminoglycoside phosphotransferase family protein [Pyrinomonadaceae bacterium]|nr:aminoglycoside phosphotransferase family protein [Pyrinomonadaceae bacterium]
MDDKQDQPATIRHYRNLAKTIVQEHFGKPASRIVYKSSGRTNFVFAVNHVEGQFVVRISPDLERLKAFQKERWASQQAREAGVPTPEVIEVSNDAVSEPYMITRRVTGSEATQHPQRKRIVHEMGEYAAVINSIHTDGYGSDFDWTSNGTKHKTWVDYVEDEYALEKRLQLFAEHELLTDEQLKELSRILEDAKTRGHTSSLNHSDLRLKNVIVDEGGDIAAIIDWEDCLSTIAPEWELSIALHDLSIDEKHAFIEGYGLSVREVEEMAPLIKAFNILNYYQAIESAKDDKSFDEIKLRLKGSLDLYSL